MDTIQEYLKLLKNTIDSINHNELVTIVELLKKTRTTNNKIIIFGNGGSACTASHFVCDINKGVSYGRKRRYKILSLSDNIPTIMSYSNDVSYDEIFIEQLKNFLEDGDVVIGFSGSGNSKNVIKAIEYANSRGNVTIGISGFNGGKLKRTALYNLNAPVNDMQISEDLHMIFIHLIMRLLYNDNE